MKIFPLPKLTPTRLVLLTAAFLILTGNWAFFEKLTEVYPLGGSNTLFVISLAVFYYCFLLLLITVFSLVVPIRIVASLFIMLTAVVSYYSDQMGIVIDTDMIRNIVETNIFEALDLINPGLVVHIVLLGIIPVILIWYAPLSRAGMLRELRYKGQLAVIAVVVMVLSLLTLGDYYASFFREHKSIRYYMHPVSCIYYIVKYIKIEFNPAEEHSFITLVDHVQLSDGDTTRELVILVIGETARADHFSLNGYERDTNPQLSKIDHLLSYSDISSCGTSTAISVPCMFAHVGREDFDRELSDHTENVLDILNRAKVNILWRDNNSSSKGVAERVTYQDYKSPTVNSVCDVECRDVGMLDGLQEYVDAQQGDVLVVLHSMGSHGPAYFKRYPKEFERFKPACNTLELSQCTTEEIINAYDNSILYADYFLAKTVEFLKRNNSKFETNMLYVSDHGESLGEGGLYLHGMPYILAPEEQTHVPVILWRGEHSDIDFEKTLELKDKPNTHDALFGALLALFEVETDLNHPGEHPLFYMEEDDDD